MSSMQEYNTVTSSRRSDAFLSKLVGTVIVVHTLVSGEAYARPGVPQAAILYGRLESIYPDALILEIGDPGQPNGGKILVYKRAIVAIEARGTTTP